MTTPRITMRAGNAPGHENDGASVSGFLEMSQHGRDSLAASVDNGNVESTYAAQVNSAASTGPEIEIMDLATVLAHMLMNGMPAHFSVPDEAMPHWLLFGNVMVTLENAAPGRLARLLSQVISDDKVSKTLRLSCAQHLLDLGVDANLSNYNGGWWSAPLHHAASIKSFKLVSLLLKYGARPDGSYEMFDCNGTGMHIGIVRELLKAGADPWQSIGRPEQLPTDGLHVSIAAFYEQTGLNINAEANRTGSSDGKLTTLELAYGEKTACVLIDLLDAGAYVGDVIRLKWNMTEQEHLDYYGACTADAIASYREQRACLPCGFSSYALLHDTLQAGPPAASHGRSTTTTFPGPASGATLAQASLKPACNALIDGLYSAAAVARLIGCLNKMPPVFSDAVVLALSLARVLGHYGAGQGARAGQLDQGIRVALAGHGLWDKYLDSKTRFETLQANIDRHQADGRTLLTAAAANGKIRMIRVLVKLGARVNYPDAHGDYPLLAAAKARKPDTCSALLSLGANAGTSDPRQRSTLFHAAEWLAQTDVSDTAGMGKVVDLVEQLFRLGYDFRQPTPEDHADHAAYPTVADLLFKPENCVKLALLGPERNEKLVQAMLFNISRRGSQPFLN